MVLGDFEAPNPPPVKEDTASVKRQHQESQRKEQSRGSSQPRRLGKDLRRKWSMSGMPHHLMVWRGK